MRVQGKDRKGCDVCNPLDAIIMRLEALEERAQSIVKMVQGVSPDGVGNVTLPTSESVDGPGYGRNDVFAMSSEVKEATDDVHQYASAIADDLLEVQTDLSALSNRVDELEPQGLDQLQSAVSALQMSLASLEVALNGKVSKTGDTMSGNLALNNSLPQVNLINSAHNVTTLPSSSLFTNIQFFDSSSTRVALLEHYRNENNRKQLALILNSSETIGAEDWSFMGLVNDIDGTYSFAPSWSVGTNDNSDKILTMKMANSLPSIAHTTGNETIGGVKTFTNNPIIQSGDSQLTMVGRYAVEEGVESNDLAIRSSDSNGKVYAGSYTYLSATLGSVHSIRSYGFNLNGERVATANLDVVATRDGKKYATAPTTPSDATSNEIATVNWVIDKINAMADANGLTRI